MPSSQGKVGASIDANICKQMQSALDLLRFVTKDDPELDCLDLKNTITPCIIAIPGSGQHNVRVVFGLGTGAGVSGIRENDLKSSLLALTGEYIDGMSMPLVLTLPALMVEKQPFKVPSQEEIEKQRLSRSVRAMGWFKATELEEEVYLPSIMPVLAFLILDAFDGDIDPLLIYKGWMDIKPTLVETEVLQCPNILPCGTPNLQPRVNHQSKTVRICQLSKSNSHQMETTTYQSPVPTNPNS